MYPYNFDETANDVIHFAFREARDLGHRFVGTEHLVLALAQIERQTISELFKQYGVTAEDIRIEVINRLGRQAQFERIEDYTYHAKTCLERSHQYAIKTNAAEILPEHLFVSIMHDPETIGYKILMALRMDVKTLLQSLYATAETGEKGAKIIKHSRSAEVSVKTLALDSDYGQSALEALSELGTDLTAIAKDAPFEAVVGREREIERMLQILSRKEKNNVCLLGEAGVGKTAIVRGLANKIAMGDVPDAYKHKRLFELNVGALVAGTMYRGQFEERMKALIDALLSEEGTIVFIDEFHQLMGVGATGDKSLDAIGLLKPYLTLGKIQIIGATTYREYEKYVKSDPALVRRMLPVHVEEPTEAESFEILKHVKESYERFHQVVITKEAVQAALKLSVRYLPERHLPDKAIDLLDEASSRKRLENIDVLKLVEELKYRLSTLKHEKEEAIIAADFERASKIKAEEKRLLETAEKHRGASEALSGQPLIVTDEDIKTVLAEWIKVPVQEMTLKDRYALSNMESALEGKVYGQEAAVRAVTKALKRARVGLKKADGPVGVFLFVGPTGVGKTELCKSVAEVYFGQASQLIRLDMSEYMERHSVSKLIGSPPGYEGSREGGYLTNAISKNPHAVVVFDEVEKAHEEVLNVLLQIMDEGHVKDGKGERHHFKDALIVMTSNLGSHTEGLAKVGFGAEDRGYEKDLAVREACRGFFKPEFLNRIDDIVVFKALESDALERVYEREIDELRAFLEERGTALEVDSSVKQHLLATYQSNRYGARPLIRGIETDLKDLIVDQLIVTTKAVRGMRLTYDEIIIIEIEE